MVDRADRPHEPARGDRPRVPARHRPDPRAVVDLLRDRRCRSWRSAPSCSCTARSRRPRSYIGFVVLGGAMTAFWLNVVWMMAAQFYWEKDQGNLELYFTAPMHLMSILAGMAIGGLVMTSSRALAVIGIGSLLYGVTYDIQQPFLLAGVFLLTMIPLYGMGMLFASLFLLWGREAYHLAELLQEPIYFLGGVNFPLARHRRGGRRRRWRPCRSAVGLDAMRQLAFAGSGVEGVLPVGAEIADPRGDGRHLPRRRAACPPLPRAPRPARGTPDAAMAVTDGTRRGARPHARGRVAQLPDRHRPRLGDRGELVRPVPVRRLHDGEAARGGADPRRHVPGHHRRPEHRVPPVPDRRQRAVERRVRRHGRPGAVDPRGPGAVPDAEVRRGHARPRSSRSSSGARSPAWSSPSWRLR